VYLCPLKSAHSFPSEERSHPSHILGILSLIALAIACVVRYSKRMQGGWRATYVITAMVSLYFNVFVLIAQSFMKVPALHALAPTGSESPFAIIQGSTSCSSSFSLSSR